MAKLYGAQRIVLQTILDASGDIPSLVEDSQIAQTTRIALEYTRDWLETLEREEYVEIDRTEAGLSASITAKGRLALVFGQPSIDRSRSPESIGYPGLPVSSTNQSKVDRTLGQYRPFPSTSKPFPSASKRGRKVLALSLTALSLSLINALGLWIVFFRRSNQGRPHSDVYPTASLSQEPQSPQPKREWTNSIGIKLVRIEAGSFLMGSTKNQIDQLMQMFPDIKREWFDGEQPQHPVKITRPFFLGIHEVTQSQYQAVMGERPSHFKGSDDLPVEQVSWLDAVLFCNKLSEQEKRTPFYRINGTKVTIAGGNGYRLPTEAEWEYACRAGSTTLYPFGDEASGLGDHAWYVGNSGFETHPVGQKRANAWGLYDMLGNVWEWCQDWYEGGYYRTSPPADPPGPSVASCRVIRGGCWYFIVGSCRPALRSRGMPESRGHGLGFRVAAVQE